MLEPAVGAHRHAHEPMHPAVIVALAPSDHPLGRFAPVHEGVPDEANGARIVAADAALEEVGGAAGKLGELDVLVVDPGGNLAVLGLPAQYRAEQLGLHLEDAGVEIVLHLHEGAQGIVGSSVGKHRARRIARTLELCPAFGALEMRGDFHGSLGLMRQVGVWRARHGWTRRGA